MTLQPMVKIDPDDMVRYLLYQQFYYGDDKIYGRTKDRFEHIEGVGDTIEDFYTLMMNHINFIDLGQPEKYLKFFNDNIHQIPVNEILYKYEEYKSSLGSDMSRGITLTVLVGEGLMEIHDKCFESTIDNLKEFIQEKKGLALDDIDTMIKTLYGKSSPDIGMIYSLSFMEFVANKVQNQKIELKCQELMSKYFSIILGILGI
jgi:hypothetical protein